MDTRRLLLPVLALLATGSALCAPSQPAQPPLTPLNRFPRMMQEWVVGEVRAAEARGDQRRAAVRTKADAEAYVKSAQERIRQSFGPLPAKTPLNARITGKVERDAYTVENIIFESRPGFPVTGNLYVPKGKTLPLPGVIGVCGHSANGKAAESYQSFAQGLARLGYVCFIIDPLGQGERFQYLKPNLESRYKPGVPEHLHLGNQLTLVGEFLGTWFAWDGIRALDYLLTRPEVDPKQVGITGNSGGGTQTAWLCGLENRWTMGAPACFITTFRRNAENELPADTEQCPPNALALDLDHSDFVAAQAPKPMILLTQEYDFFDIRGTETALPRLQHLYGLLGRADNIRIYTGSSPHSYSQELREAMYRFFNGVTRISDAQKEPALVIEKDPVLWASAKGQINAEPGFRTVFSFVSEKAAALAKARKSPNDRALETSLLRILAMPAASDIPDFRILRGLGGRKYPAKGYCTYAVETEKGVHALVTRLDDATLISRPPRTAKRAILYVSHRSADAELRAEPLVRELIATEPDAVLYAMDVRGIGESQPDTCGKNQFLAPYGSDYFISAHSLMLGKPYLGQKTFDVLRVIAWLKSRGHGEIHLAGRGWGALPAAFAGLLAPEVRQVTLKNALTSYQEVAQAEDYRWPYAVMLPNVLAHFDLPDVYRALAAKRLRNDSPWGALDGMND